MAIQGDIACEISASMIGFGVPVNRGVGESKVDASETAAHIIQDEGVSSRLRGDHEAATTFVHHFSAEVEQTRCVRTANVRFRRAREGHWAIQSLTVTAPHFS